MNISPRLSHRSEGIFDAQNWISEGDGLLASSQKVRETWAEHRKTFSENIVHKRNVASDWPLLTGLPRSSMLLLGYAAEMYLKAGIVKAYIGCSHQMFDRDIKRLYRHNFPKMAEELKFSLSDGDREDLATLQNMVLADARYPIEIGDGGSYADAKNEQTSRIWNSDNYARLLELVNRLRAHSSLIDADCDCPCTYFSYQIDNDGCQSRCSHGCCINWSYNFCHLAIV